MTSPVTLKLGSREYKLRWTPRSDARLSSQGYSLDKVVADLRSPERIYYTLCLLLWCAIVNRENFPYKSPEDVADDIPTIDEQQVAFAAVRTAMEDAGVLDDGKKKLLPDAKPSSTGPSASSS